MKAFIEKYEDRIHGVLSCFDRMLFRGYLPIMSGWSMAQFLKAHDIGSDALKPFLLANAERIKAHALDMAAKHGRPFQYLSTKLRMEDAARKLAETDGIEEGLVCVFSVLQPCRTFSFRFHPGQPYVRSAKRKCLHLYYYFMDRELGLIHVRVQSWFPLQIQIYLNGHEWLARELDTRGIDYCKLDNVFTQVEDLPQAQRLANRFSQLKWPAILNEYASRVVPQLDDVLFGCEYYWVTAQAEYATDVMFKTAAGLRELYPRLLSHSTLCFGAEEVMNFLGRKLTGHFQGEIVSDLSSLACRRVGGSRIKHRVKQNWLKMYDKAGLVLRIETVINNPEEFRVRKQVLREGKQRAEWVPLRKGVAYLFRYREISLQANARYLDALAAVDDPTPGKQALQRLTTTKKDAAGRSCPGFNPLAKPDADLFKSLMAGEHCLHGFTNRDIRARLAKTQLLRSCVNDPKKASAKVGRCFRRLHAHGLIAKIPRTRRWRVTDYGRKVMGTTTYLREHHFPNVYAGVAH
jgi:hypothetical protein